MSDFTRRLKDVLEDDGGSWEERNGVIIVNKPEIIGLGTYPIFDEGYRKRLNGLIFTEYMNREIAHETAPIFRARVRNHMMMNMPLFNKMYQADLHEISPLLTSWGKSRGATNTASDTTNEGTAESGSVTGAKARSVSSETPQSMLAGDKDYATAAADSFNESTSDSTSKELGTSKNLVDAVASNEYEGYAGHAIELIERYKRALSSVDFAIVQSLEPYFMFLYSNNNPMTGRNY